MMKDLTCLFSKRYLASVVFLSNLSLKRMYFGSYLGIIWSIIQPATYIAIMSIVMAHIMKFPIEDYPLLLMAGLVPWTLITAAATQGSYTLINSSAAFKNTILPKTIFVIAEMLLQVYIFLIAFIVMYLVIILFFADHRPTIFLLPFAAAPLLITSFSLGILFAYIGPYMRDISHMLNVGFQAFFWLTPIVYPISMLPEQYQHIQQFNPFYILIRPVQTVTYHGEWPPLFELETATLIAVLVTAIAILVAKKLRRNVIYYL